MRIPPPFWQGVKVTAAAALMLSLVSACKPAATPAAPAKPVAAKPSAIASAPTNAVEASVSVFEQLVPPKGRDPFFPNSRRREPEPVKGVSLEKAPPSSGLELKGVVGSANHRLALINDRTILGVGEEESVSVPGGRVKVRCLEIGEDYAVIQVAGEVQTKRLQLSKKGL
jgi:hypothetical protein